MIEEHPVRPGGEEPPPPAPGEPGKGGETTAFELKVPLGLPEVPIPEDNPMSADKVELKLRYFYFEFGHFAIGYPCHLNAFIFQTPLKHFGQERIEVINTD